MAVPPPPGELSSWTTGCPWCCFCHQTGTHIHEQEASGQQVAPGQHEAPQQVFAAAVEVGELPAQEGQPGRRGA